MPNPNGRNHELVIDRNDLDREVCEQASRSQDAGLEAARLASVRDEKKDRAKVVAAERAIEIRRELADEGGRITEAQIEQRLMTDPDRIAAQQALIDAEHDCADAEVRRDAWRERGYMLRTLAELYAAGYFAAASLTGTQREVAEREGTVARTAVAAERRRRRINA